MKRTLSITLTIIALFIGPLTGPLTGAAAAQSVKIGFVTTLTTPAAVIGNDMRDAVHLAVSHLNGKMGDLDIEILFEDDGLKPEIGKQKTDKLVKQDDVDFVAGYIWSHVLLASRKSVFDAGKFLISACAGPSRLAGRLCHENFFSTGGQNDQAPMALGQALDDDGVGSLYIIAPNYAAGKDMAAGVERTFKGKVTGKDLTKWPDQLDFSAELAKAKASGAEGIFAFYPGKAGPAFIRQYQQAGLHGKIALYTVDTIDAISLPRLQEADMAGVLGSKMTKFWDQSLDNPQNKRFVEDFRAEYHRYPSFYAAQSYDAIHLIDHAVRAVGGDLTDRDGIREAMASAEFPSVRGRFIYGHNHFPIQNFYLRQVVEDGDGNWTTKVIATVFENHQDPYASECKR
uniref:Branched-chain amino acid transport system substrate-binding protein n=1 Tax=Candidatus Kentrum sp. FM TaxID=2126340 RepID=A0A450W1A9_9GAMM|nr:MAG: branched-chain amino acid transport system substrate-binding protein [Candidatus Kentron sp. FM]VFJ55730.1 MAG: branched-chain amino acid transport system substrate-binding protein [Candidatus Kentron sp. FM]VFK10795.1 MAG: branched-chain amino acid transport system substrate-binding protein [Candidatus Kentron sp. FM]